jgi:EAL domain-containing protein (putative c-di-GMP-specific phosphodiesterase class I)
VSAVIALSVAIGATTVAEGVETLPELEQVRQLGCDVAQGFYFSRPLPAGAFEELLTTAFPGDRAAALASLGQPRP